jgi:lipopolysaccharide transport system ATP-binding protein
MSNSDTVISVQSLSKRYLVGHEGPQERYHSLRDTIVRHGKNFLRKTVDMAKGKQIIQGDTVEEFWALKDVSFEVKRGEVLGIIGRNGAGKSTLLKILSRITEPTSGKVTLRGRVASLLEVGTGFHPELSGRENIFLNGAILGMSRAEIKGKFDEIVEFSGVEKFLDTPVKRYSSGMYVRLAFAVAAHLEPEILIVDEVLAVGDAEFQKKCLGKLQDVSNVDGRAVILVSHNLGQISNLAHKCIVLQNGAVKFQGRANEALSRYHDSSDNTSSEWIQQSVSKKPRLVRMTLITSEPGNVQAYGKPLIMEFELDHSEAIHNACFSFQIVNSAANPIVHLWQYSTDSPFANTPGRTILRCEISFLRLNVGIYSFRTYFSGPPGSSITDMAEPKISFEVIRLDKDVLFGWRSEACAYFEESSWKKSYPI